jgi:protein-S-isoprenylcysteine O-methyltransferase Ste14
MKRFGSIVFGFVAYAIFFLTFLYAIGFVANIGVPKSIDSGMQGPVSSSVIINIVLLSIFALQHSVMARPSFKQWWTNYIPIHLERSVYVVLSSLTLILIFACWQPMTSSVWAIDNVLLKNVIWTIYLVGWLMVLVSSFLINHFDLFGVRQVYLYFRNKPYTDVEFKVVLLYKLVRHPIMLGFIIAFWATPDMTTGHLMFALVTTAYILIAIQFEEHDLSKRLGDGYAQYRKQVSMIVPKLRNS